MHNVKDYFVNLDAQRGLRIRQERDKRGWSQQQAADAVGIRREMWAKYEAGAEPGAKALTGMAAVNVDVLYILTGQRSSEAPALTADEREMLALFQSATLTGKAAAIGALQGAAGAAHAPKIHIAGGAHGQIADVIHNNTTRAPARKRAAGGQ